MRLHRALLGIAAVLLGTSPILGADVAEATFPGAQNGNISFVAICDGTNIGQAIYSLNPNGNPPPTYTCPGGTPPNYVQSTAGATDSMPYFSANGSNLYFASSRGNGGHYAVYEASYPNTVSGSPGSQTDGAVQLTTPGTFNDFSPTVSADGSKLAFVRCDSGGASCSLNTQSPVLGGTPSLVTTAHSLSVPNSVSGAGSRPEFNPGTSDQIVYVDTSGHIRLASLSNAFAERDLSTESGIGSSSDEYPDWNPVGTRIILDSNRNSGHKIFILHPTVNPATITQLWASDPGTEIEPLYSPDGTEYAWTKLGTGSNLQIDVGTMWSNPNGVYNLTANRTNNSQPAWQPVPLGTALPEAPATFLLAVTGGLSLAGAALFLRRRQPR